MTREQFMFLRGLFNLMDLDLPTTNKIQEDAINAFKDIRKMFNKEYDSVTIGEMQEMIKVLDSINERFENVKNVFNQENMN